MDDKNKKEFIQMKKERRQKKRCEKRLISGEEVIFIFEKVLEGWKTIQLFKIILVRQSIRKRLKQLQQVIVKYMNPN